MEYQVLLTARAWKDLASIRAYIAQNNPGAADTFTADLILQARALATFPHRGASISRFPGRYYVPYGKYLICYKIVPREVHILRFWHGAQDQSRLRLRETSPPFPVLHSV